MYGVAPGASAPFYVPTSLPSKHACGRSRRKTASSFTPFRDETKLVGLRYDQTVAAEPPIPIPPPRSPLRPSPSISAQKPQAQAQAQPTGRPFSWATPQPMQRPIVVPPPRPPPPTEQHPALRTITSPRTVEDVLKRDSILAPTTSSQGQTFFDDSSDESDYDPFAYEKINNRAPTTPVRPLQLTPRSVSPSIYSQQDQEEEEEEEPGRKLELEARVSESNNSGFSEALSSPGLTDGNTIASVPPSTPPPSHKSQNRFMRALSFRSNSIRRLTKKSQGEMQMQMITTNTSSSSTGSGPGSRSGPGLGSGSGAPQLVPMGENPGRTEYSVNSLKGRAAPNNSAAASAAARVTGTATGRLSPSYHPDSSPIISTFIPTESLLEDDFVTQLSFSKRGSIILGGKRPPQAPHKHKPMMMIMSADNIPVRENENRAEQIKEIRAFPLVPHATKPSSSSPSTSYPSPSSPSPSSPSPSHGAYTHTHPRTYLHPYDRDGDRNRGYANTNTNASDSDSDIVKKPTLAPAPALAPAPTSRPMPPSIRLISEELEKESQKVRSLYESGEDLHWEEGRRHSSPEPRLLVSPDEDENDSLANLPRGRHTRPTSASTSSLHVSIAIRPHELAGGVEDWEGVDGHDVDRYGFITPHRSTSRPATSSGSMSVRFSPRKQRNVLTRKDSNPLSLGLRRLPSRKLSARSLHTQASELSTASRRSTRSALRQATNLLPHNRDRRLVDQAGDLLALQPGLSHISEDETAEKVALELKYKEAQRSDKWRRMAKVVRPGPEGQGMLFEFDIKQPKIVERTWKGIPDCWRAAAWYSFLATSAKASPKPFISDEEIKADFHRLLEIPSPDDGQIDLDVPRTINQHIMFRKRYRGGQRLLFRVLHNLSLYFPETGYVQGMAPLAATFLSYYDEESCFVMLVRLWKFRGLNRIYQSGFEELISALKDFEANWLGTSGQDVAKKLEELCIDPTAYATRWYLTLFNLSIPFSIQLRIWDLFMLLGSSPEEDDTNATPDKGLLGSSSSKGYEILHATSMAIIDTLRETLLDSDFENAMKALTSWIPIKDERRFLEVVRAEYKRSQVRARKA
ncbi:rab-GTPase-TBC domain-containing protein [Camillea tinctor]|nr:rab-GTPase-TBC domain-containing protein [Camillea tinctor]